MRASGVNAAIMRVIGKLKGKKMRAIGIMRIGVARITGFYFKYLPDLSIFNLLSVFVLVQRILNYYPTYRLYFGEVKTPYCYSTCDWLKLLLQHT